MSDVLVNDAQLELQTTALSADVEDMPIVADLHTDNLILRLYQPGGVPDPGDPFFSSEIPGGLTVAQQDLIVKAVQDSVIAAAVAAAQDASSQTLEAEVMARQLADGVLTASITSESATRQTNEESVAVQLSTMGSRIDTNVAAIQTESITRSTAVDSLATQINQVVATSAANTAAINNIETAYVAGDSALSARLDTVVANVAQNTANITTEQQARVDGDSALATQISQVSASVGSNSALITSLQTALTNANQSNASQLLSLSATLNGHTASINNEITARANGDSANASAISSLTTTVNGNTATISSHQQSINGIYGQYAVSIDVNGNATGFNLINNSGWSSFRVSVDYFTIQKPGYAGQQPFVVQNVNGVPTLSVAAAVIGDATITSAKIANAAITSATIGTAQIGTLHVAGNAISTMATNTGAVNAGLSYQSVGGNILILAVTGALIVDIYVNGTLMSSGNAAAQTWCGVLGSGTFSITATANRDSNASTYGSPVTLTVFEAKR